MSYADASSSLGKLGLLVMGGIVLALGAGLWLSQSEMDKAVNGIRFEAVRAGFINPTEFNGSVGQSSSVKHFIERMGYWQNTSTLSKEKWQAVELEAFEMLAKATDTNAVAEAAKWSCRPQGAQGRCNYYEIARKYKVIISTNEKADRDAKQAISSTLK